ncbi:metal-dependent phosphohydrolase, partial [Streptomyces sp. UNOC14_S4]|nr:metal-dependent phosphohydrolase [Streptomyces sp. UNOC14_S4]
MRSLPATARGCVACAAVAATLCAAPLARHPTAVPWAAVAALAAVGAACERLPRRTLTLPVLLAGAFLLPPAAAALVAVPGALLARTGQGAGDRQWARRCWHAAQSALAACAASYAFTLLGALLGPPA